MAKSKAAEAAAETAPAEKITQRVAVERALAAGKELPPDGVKFVKDTFGMELTNGNFSTLKSQIKKAAEGSTGTRKPGRPAKSNTAGNGKAPAGGSLSVGKVASAAELAQAVKTLVKQYGAEAVADMTKVFAD